MSITSSNVSSLYITMFNRAPEGAGHKFWLDTANANKLDITQLSQMMLDSKPAKEYFAGKEANADFVNHIYKNLFNKTSAEDAEGVKFWVDKLNIGNSKAFIVTEMLKAATNNTYTKPEDLKAQNLFKNKVKAAEAVSKVIVDVPESGTILEKISGFNAILKNIKDTSTPTQIAQVIKQEALKGKLKISDDKTIADSLKAIFPSSDSAAIEKALNSTTVDTNIYPSVPTPPTPTPPGGSGGNSGGGSGGSSGGSPSPKPTPDEIKQQELDKKAKEAEENLKAKEDVLKSVKVDKDVADKIKDVITKPANGNDKEKMLEDINQQIAGAAESEKVKLEAAKKELEKLSDPVTPLEKEVATGKALVAQKKVDLAEKEKAVAEDEKDIANFLAKEKALNAVVASTTQAHKKATFDKTVAEAIETNKGGTGIKTIQEVITDAKDALTTEEEKAAAEAQIKALAALLNLELSDKTTKRFVEKTKENSDKADKVQEQASSEQTAAEAAKAAAQGAKTDAENKIHKDKIAVIKANVALKDTEKVAADQNLSHDPTNPDLQKAAKDAEAAFEEAKNKGEVEITKLLADKFKAVILEKDGDTNVYKSADGKYIIDITGDTVTANKTLVVGEDNKLYEIDVNSPTLAGEKLTTKILLVKESDTKAATFKNGAGQINFILKDGKLQAAFKDAKGFIPSGNTDASYANLSKAAIADDSFSINDTQQQGHSVVLTGSKVDKIKIAAGEYTLTDTEKPELASIESITEKTVDDVKFPLINGKVMNGTIGSYTIGSEQNKLESIRSGDKKFFFDDVETVKSLEKIVSPNDYARYLLKNSIDFKTAKVIIQTSDDNIKSLSFAVLIHKDKVSQIVNLEQDTFSFFGNGNDDTVKVINSAADKGDEIQASNLDKAVFKDIEKFDIAAEVTELSLSKFNSMTDAKTGNKTQEIKLSQALTINEAKGEISLDISDIKGEKVTLNIVASAESDSIKLDEKSKGLIIKGFVATSDKADKIDFKALGVTATTAESAIEYNSDTEGFTGNKIYNVLAGIVKAADQIKFADLFADAGKPFDNADLDALVDGTKSIISVIGNNGKTGLYLVDVKGGNGLNNDDDITLIGVLDGALNLSDANIVS